MIWNPILRSALKKWQSNTTLVATIYGCPSPWDWSGPHTTQTGECNNLIPIRLTVSRQKEPEGKVELECPNGHGRFFVGWRQNSPIVAMPSDVRNHYDILNCPYCKTSHSVFALHCTGEELVFRIFGYCRVCGAGYCDDKWHEPDPRRKYSSSWKHELVSNGKIVGKYVDREMMEESNRRLREAVLEKFECNSCDYTHWVSDKDLARMPKISPGAYKPQCPRCRKSDMCRLGLEKLHWFRLLVWKFWKVRNFYTLAFSSDLGNGFTQRGRRKMQ